MGLTVDLSPLLPGESPESAIERIYDGGTTFIIDQAAYDARPAPVDTDVTVAPVGAFDEWRNEAIKRVYELFPEWMSEKVNGYPHLWTSAFGWQVEFGRDDITLRHRRASSQVDGLDDISFLALFDGLGTIIHWPDFYGTYRNLDDPDDRPETIDNPGAL